MGSRLRRSSRLQARAPPPTAGDTRGQPALVGSTRETRAAEHLELLVQTRANEIGGLAQLELEFLLNPASSSEDSVSDSVASEPPPDFDNDFEFRFGELDEVLLANETQDIAVTDNVERVPDMHRRTGRTTRWIGGYKYTRANKSLLKLSYRYSHYLSGCPGKCDFVARVQRYTNFVAHTCGRCVGNPDDDNNTSSITRDVTVAMKREVDRMAVSMTASRSAIWEMVSAQFYGSRDQNTGIAGLTREYVTRRVNRVRAEEFGGSVYGQIEVSPWSQILSEDGLPTDTNFLLFHVSYFDERSKTRERLLGWGHPVLLNMLKQKKTSVFVDGTFRCVPPRLKQCIVCTRTN